MVLEGSVEEMDGAEEGMEILGTDTKGGSTESTVWRDAALGF